MHITILIPAFQTKQYLTECLTSIFKQSYTDFDILIVDDGSTDGTKELAELFISKYPVSVISLSENKGVTYATHIGIQAAQGPIITIVDSDDIIYKHSLATGIKAFKDPKVGFAWSRFTKSTTGKMGWTKNVPAGMTLYYALMYGNWWCASHQRFFRKSTYIEGIHLNTTIDRSSDFQLALLIASTGCKTIYMPEVTYWYRMKRPGSLTSQGSGKQKQAVEVIKKWVKKELKKRGINEPS